MASQSHTTSAAQNSHPGGVTSARSQIHSTTAFITSQPPSSSSFSSSFSSSSSSSSLSTSTPTSIYITTSPKSSSKSHSKSSTSTDTSVYAPPTTQSRLGGSGSGVTKPVIIAIIAIVAVLAIVGILWRVWIYRGRRKARNGPLPPPRPLESRPSTYFSPHHYSDKLDGDKKLPTMVALPYAMNSYSSSGGLGSEASTPTVDEPYSAPSRKTHSRTHSRSSLPPIPWEGHSSDESSEVQVIQTTPVHPPPSFRPASFISQPNLQGINPSRSSSIHSNGPQRYPTTSSLSHLRPATYYSQHSLSPSIPSTAMPSRGAPHLPHLRHSMAIVLPQPLSSSGQGHDMSGTGFSRKAVMRQDSRVSMRSVSADPWAGVGVSRTSSAAGLTDLASREHSPTRRETSPLSRSVGLAQ